MARNITREELMAIPSPPRTKSWNPIPHHEVLSQTEKAIAEIGIGIMDTRIEVTNSGSTRAFVRHRLDVPVEGAHLEIGWRNGIDKTLSIGFTAGTTIMVCSNMVLSGSWLEFKKHTGKLELEDVFQMALRGVEEGLQNAYNQIEWQGGMRAVKKSRLEADHLFMTMLRQGIVTPTKVLELANAYDEEVARGGDSLYTVYQSATQTFRDAPLYTVADRSKMLNRLMMQNMIGDMTSEEARLLIGGIAPDMINELIVSGDPIGEVIDVAFEETTSASNEPEQLALPAAPEQVEVPELPSAWKELTALAKSLGINWVGMKRPALEDAVREARLETEAAVA